MDEAEYLKNQASLYQKKSKLRELVLKCDWKKDGRMVLGGKMVEYISAAKVAKNFAPLLPKVGLEIVTNFGAPEHHAPVGQKGEEHWTIPFVVQYVDTETGAMSQPCSYYGEAVDPRDKGLKKACTDARKLWLITDFNIEEGIDPELSGAEGTFTPRSDEETVEIKTKIADVAVKPKAPLPPVKKEPVVLEKVDTKDATPTVSDGAPAVVQPEAPKEEPKEEPKAEEPAKPKRTVKKKTEPAPEAPKEEPKEAPKEDDSSRIAPGMNTPYGEKITEVQKKPLFSALGKWSLAHMEGKVSDEKYEEVKNAYKNIDSNAAVIRFLTIYREVKG